MIDPTYDPMDALDTYFGSLSHSALIVRADNIGGLLSVHPGFPQERWPYFVTAPAQLKGLAETLKQTDLATVNGGKDRTAERNAARAELDYALYVVGQYLMMVAMHENDPSLLLNTGYRLKSRSAGRHPAPISPLPVPNNFKLRHGKVTGTLIGSSGKVRGAAGYEIRYCKGDSISEGEGEMSLHFTGCRNMALKGLEAAQRYAFQIRCLGPAGPSPWSQSLVFIVI